MRPSDDLPLWKWAATGIVAVALFCGVTWIGVANDWALFRAFAPRYEQVRRETFEQSKAYRQGMVQELENMQFEYEKADPAHRTALRSIILHRSADVDETTLTPSLREFLSRLRNGSGDHAR